MSSGKADFNLPAILDEIRVNAGTIASRTEQLRCRLVGSGAPEEKGAPAPTTIEGQCTEAIRVQRISLEDLDHLDTILTPIK